MSISAINDLKCSDDLWQRIMDRKKAIKKHLRSVKGSPNYRMGYGAGYEGYEPTEHDLRSQDEIYPGYAKGIRDEIHDGLAAGVWTRESVKKEMDDGE